LPGSDFKPNATFSIVLVFLCTLLGAGAQILMKSGVATLHGGSLAGLVAAIFTNWRIFAGFALYGLSTGLLVVSLKYGQLSILYPVIALTYVWVTALSVYVYGEVLNSWKMLGLVTVVFGVAMIGRGMKRA
jgi:multidrug transporter EmrE-like cation transporter